MQRGLTKRWTITQPATAVEPGGEHPAATIETLPLPERILAARGLADPDIVSRFLDPKLKHLHDPALLPGAARAAQRLVEAVKASERIVIYGDYDVDGITASAMLYHTIRAVEPAADVHTFVPHRLEDGYGLNTQSIAQLADDGARLIISVDCGINAINSAQLARDRGVDLIITDHHNLPEGAEHDPGKLPQAYELVHPRLPGSDYPFGELCGAGVAFKLCWQFAITWCGSQRVSKQLQQTLMHMLPLAAMGTIADVVPLVDENRVLACFGLRLMKQTPLPGLHALLDASKLLDEKIDDQTVGFVLGPRLNACGRMGHAREAVRLLTEATGEETTQLAEHLAAMNRTRQSTERTILNQAMRLAEETGQLSDEHRIIVLAHPDWHPGVVGIVCSRLVDRFGRPAVLMQSADGVCKGSARSIDGYSIHEGIATCRDMLTTFGGHDMAAGLSFDANRLDEFRTRVLAHANAGIDIAHLTPAITIDCDAQLPELDLQQVGRLETLAPFGRTNPRPSVRLTGLTIAQPPRVLGAHGKHLEIRCKQDIAGRPHWLRCMWWSGAEQAGIVAAGQQVDLVIEPKLNHFNGRTSVEGIIRDVYVHRG